MRWLAMLTVVWLIFSHMGVSGAAADLWMPGSDLVPPGGFATVAVEHPKQGSRVPGPDVKIRLRSDNPNAAIFVKLNGRHVDFDGRPHTPPPSNPYDRPQWSFDRDLTVEIPVRLAPGVHSLTIERGAFGSSLPDVNEQTISFVVK